MSDKPPHRTEFLLTVETATDGWVANRTHPGMEAMRSGAAAFTRAFRASIAEQDAAGEFLDIHFEPLADDDDRGFKQYVDNLAYDYARAMEIAADGMRFRLFGHSHCYLDRLENLRKAGQAVSGMIEHGRITPDCKENLIGRLRAVEDKFSKAIQKHLQGLTYAGRKR